MPQIFVMITLALGMLYAVLIVFYTFYYKKLKVFRYDTDGIHSFKTFSIIVPARNEENNIAQCLRSILNNSYPRDSYEIIVIDDHSQDGTAAIVNGFCLDFPNVRLWKMSDLLPDAQRLNSYKKKAISLAIARAQGEYIICTDADCHVGRYWLAGFNAYLQKTDALFVAAPVQFENDGSFISIFQCLDFMSLQGITAASVASGTLSMCNGANLCYAKSAFVSVDGFTGVDKVASGDDMFLMFKILKAFPGRVGYLFAPASIVRTRPMPDVRSFVHQRIRWASKADKYEDKRIIAVLLLVYLFNLLLLVLFVWAFFDPRIWLWWVGIVLGKTLVEMGIMRVILRFFDQMDLLKWFPLMQPFHVFYTVVAGFLGKIGKYQWKGRTVK